MSANSDQTEGNDQNYAPNERKWTILEASFYFW